MPAKKNTGSKRATTKASTRDASEKKSGSSNSRTTIDHDEIQQWAEERDAQPACVKGTGNKNDVGMLRLDFPGYSEDKLQPITWDEFFEKFDERGLALVYQEKTAGGERSNFNKLVSRETSEEKPTEKPKARHAH